MSTSVAYRRRGTCGRVPPTRMNNMEIDFTYGTGIFSLDIPVSADVDIFKPLENLKPFSFKDFNSRINESHIELLLTSDKYLCVVNDGYRNTQTALILKWLSKLDSKFLDNADFIIATGTHDAPTDSHYRKIFGEYYNQVISRIKYHDANDYDSMVKLGVDNLGGEVWINKAIEDYSSILIIGSVEPHYFAGFTGGRKSLFPGLCDIFTIERNHNMAVSLEAAPLKIIGNPVAEHLESLLDFVDLSKIISIQIVMDSEHNIVDCFCGTLSESFKNAQETTKAIYCSKIEKQYDLILAEILPPLDGNLYQAQKALEHCHNAVKDGGDLILISACKEGIGSKFFYELAQNWDRIENKPINGEIKFGSHKLSRVNEMTKRINIYLYSEMKPEEVRHVFYEPLDNLQKFIYSRVMDCENINIGIVRDAGHMVLST